MLWSARRGGPIGEIYWSDTEYNTPTKVILSFKYFPSLYRMRNTYGQFDPSDMLCGPIMTLCHEFTHALYPDLRHGPWFTHLVRRSLVRLSAYRAAARASALQPSSLPHAAA